MSLYLLTNFEIQLYYQTVSTRNKSSNNAKEAADVTNPHELVNTGTHYLARYVKNNNEIYSHIILVARMPKEYKNFFSIKSCSRDSQ